MNADDVVKKYGPETAIEIARDFSLGNAPTVVAVERVLRRDAVVQAICAGRTIREAARIYGVSEDTARRYWQARREIAAD